MAIKNPSMFTYGYFVDGTNKYLPFRVVSDVEYIAVLDEGYYSGIGLAQEIVRAMNVQAPTTSLQVNIDRSYSSGTQNRWTIKTFSSFLSIMFGSGTSASDSIYSQIGFLASDYTGATTYLGASDTGAKLFTEYPAYTYLPPQLFKTQTGVVTSSTRGDKETIVWSTQRFIQGEFKFEPELKVKTDWQTFFDWSSKIRPFDFTPDYTLDPNETYNVTLEKTTGAGNGLGFKFQEQLPQFPFNYTTGQIQMRVVPASDE